MNLLKDSNITYSDQLNEYSLNADVSNINHLTVLTDFTLGYANPNAVLITLTKM